MSPLTGDVLGGETDSKPVLFVSQLCGYSPPLWGSPPSTKFPLNLRNLSRRRLIYSRCGRSRSGTLSRTHERHPARGSTYTGYVLRKVEVSEINQDSPSLIIIGVKCQLL